MAHTAFGCFGDLKKSLMRIILYKSSNCVKNIKLRGEDYGYFATLPRIGADS